MVTKGQFLERPTLIPVGQVVMEGLSHRGDLRPPVLILPPPPQEGGSMDHVVAAEVAWACASRGFPTLRFNYRGVGGSQGARGGGPSLLEDAVAALRLLEENTSAKEFLVVSIGGSAEVAQQLVLGNPAVVSICWVSPLWPLHLLEVRGPLLVLVGEHDLRQPRAALEAELAQVGGRLEVVEGADQAFTRNLAQVGRLVALHLQRLGDGSN